MNPTRTWEDVERGIVQGLRTAFACAEDQIYWQYQPGLKTQKPFYALHIASDTPVSEYVSVRETFDAEKNKIATEYMLHRELVVQIVAYGRGIVGSHGARAMLSNGQIMLRSESVKQIWEHVGLALVEFGGVQSLPVVEGSTFESRATVDVRFRLCDSAIELTDYITRVEVTRDDNQ